MTAYADGVINITENTGGILLNHVESYNDDVYLTSINHSILGGLDLRIIGKNIILNANTYIGYTFSDETIIIDLKGGNLTANAGNVILVLENSGDLIVNHVESISNDVYLSALDGNILESNTDSIVGENIYLTTFGSNNTIGTSVNPIHIDIKSGKLLARSDGLINIEEIDGDLKVDTVESLNGNVILTTLNGSILDSTASDNTNITANEFIFNITNGSLGSADEDIVVDLVTPNFNFSLDGDINLTYVSGDIALETIESTASVTLTAREGNIIDNLVEKMQTLSVQI